MDAPVFIVAVPFDHGARRFDFGDRYDRSGLSDEIDRVLRINRRVVELTRESYRNAIAHRPVGAIGVGFTTDYLLERGIIDEADGVKLGVFPLGAERYRGYWIVKRKFGQLVKHEVLNGRHEPMRDKKFNSVKNAKAFIDTLPAEEEGDDGVHVRPGPVQSDQPDQAEAR